MSEFAVLAPTRTNRKPNLNSSRILIVDDTPDNREVLIRRLAPLGAQCVEAGDGRTALRLIAAQPFDAVLLDIAMPGLDGLEVLKAIRETRSAGELPVIMVTANAQAEEVVSALALGANDYITKPVNFAIAIARIETQLHRRQAETGLREAMSALTAASEDVKAANQAKDAFLATMSHEIRTPLNGVLGLASVLSTLCTEPRQQEIVNTIVESGRSLERLLSDMLDAAKMQSGKLEVRSEAFQLEDMVRRCASLFAPLAREKGLTFELTIEPPAQGRFNGDSVRVQQILNNLLGNALKFTSSGTVSCHVAREGEICSFAVRDTGIGFDAETGARLFRRFEQADSSIAPRFGGTGLGLAISKDLAELMGGSLEAVSVPGEGSTFTLSLAMERVSSPATETVSPEAADQLSGTRPRILVADDNSTNRRVVELILAAAGVDIHAVENGEQAIAAFRAERFDLVLMDVQMPIVDGLTAIRELRLQEREHGFARTPIFALSAHTSSEHRQDSMAAGADRHMTKPLVAETLLQAVGEVLSDRPKIAAA